MLSIEDIDYLNQCKRFLKQLYKIPDNGDYLKILEKLIQEYKKQKIQIEQLKKTINRKMSKNKRLSRKYLKEKHKNKQLETNHERLINDISFIAESLELKEDATIDEIAQAVSNNYYKRLHTKTKRSNADMQTM